MSTIIFAVAVAVIVGATAAGVYVIHRRYRDPIRPPDPEDT